MESHSDIDLLLVCRPSRKLLIFKDIQEVFEGWFDKLSLTIYSEKELHFLESAKSLFLLHLSREACLLFDKTNILRGMLSTFEPKQSYRSDFAKCVALIDPLRVEVAGTPNQCHRLSYIYSLFRVFGVYLLAEKGIYEFSKSRMVRLLGESYPSQKVNVDLLSMLRVLNSNFFSGGPSIAGFFEWNGSVSAMTAALASLVQLQVNVKPMPYGEAVAKFTAEIGDRRRALDYRLRMWFLLLVYDGLNLYCSRVGRRTLNNLSDLALRSLLGTKEPKAISDAISETREYLSRYPLKYFLSDESKIGALKAREILEGISGELERG